VEAIDCQEPAETDGEPGRGEHGVGCASTGLSLGGKELGRSGGREGGREGRLEGPVVPLGERRVLGSQRECQHVLAGGGGRKAAVLGREAGRAEGHSSATLRLLVPHGSLPVAL